MERLVLLGAATLASFGAAAHAQVAYTNSALNGCYDNLASSVDSGAAAVNRDSVGTTCFDGKGHIMASTTAPH